MNRPSLLGADSLANKHLHDPELWPSLETQMHHLGQLLWLKFDADPKPMVQAFSSSVPSLRCPNKKKRRRVSKNLCFHRRPPSLNARLGTQRLCSASEHVPVV